MANGELHVVFGVGQVGSQLTELLLARGLRVRAVRRSPQTSHHARLECVRADVYDKAAAIQAAAGATVVYHCMNAPYHQWATQLPPLYRHIAAAAQAAGARLVVLDNVYAVGANGVFDEATPELPRAKKGEIRKMLADELRALHASGTVAVTIGRASDFFGPHVDQGMLQHPRSMAQLRAGQTVDVTGTIDQPHSWSYAPDVASGLLHLGLHPELAGQTYHLPVLPPQTGRALLTGLAGALGVTLKTREMPGWMLRAAGVFSPMMRELPEMQYQFTAPFVMNDAKFRAASGLAPTPLDAQLAATAAWMRTPTQA